MWKKTLSVLSNAHGPPGNAKVALDYRDRNNITGILKPKKNINHGSKLSSKVNLSH